MKREFKVENAVIHLLGAPGAGKYTIAQKMTQLADLRLVDNHLINNILFSIVRADGKTPLPVGIWDRVATIWDVVADTMVHLCPPHSGFVLTNALFEGDVEDRKHMEKMRQVAAHRKGAYVPVRLLIGDVEEHRRRIMSPIREQRMKEMNPSAAARYAAKEILKTGLAEELTLDISAVPAGDAARRILSHVVAVEKK
jgi:hypothetical protein